MSGGSFGYLYSRADGLGDAVEYESMADEMGRWPDAQARMREIATLLRQAEKIHEEMSTVMHDVEWWKSCDYGEDQVDDGVEEWRAKRGAASLAESVNHVVDDMIKHGVGLMTWLPKATDGEFFQFAECNICHARLSSSDEPIVLNGQWHHVQCAEKAFNDLRSDNERLRGLIKGTFNDRSRADCQWCDGGARLPKGGYEHAPNCPAFTPDGAVK